MNNKSRNNNILYEVVPIRLLLIVLLVFYHAFAIFSGAWSPIAGYPEIPLYDIIDKLSYTCLLETFVFISGYILGFQVSKKGDGYIHNVTPFLTKKLKRLILPSILFSVIYMFLFNGYEMPLPTVIYNLLSGTGHMWFLPMLFWCFVFVFLAEKTRLSRKWMVGASFIMLFASFLPLPFRINTAMYYFVYFYIGYCIKRYVLSFPYNGARKYQLLIAGFVFAFMLKINVCEIDDLRTGGGILHALYLMFSISIRFVNAAIGTVLLMMLSKKFVDRSDTSKWNNMLNLSDCCFGVYIFQQFILMLLEQTELSQNVSPYIYPWITFLMTLFLSLVLTVIIRKTKIGSQLL